MSFWGRSFNANVSHISTQFNIMFPGELYVLTEMKLNCLFTFNAYAFDKILSLGKQISVHIVEVEIKVAHLIHKTRRVR